MIFTLCDYKYTRIFFCVMCSSTNITYLFGLFEWYEYSNIFSRTSHSGRDQNQASKSTLKNIVWPASWLQHPECVSQHDREWKFQIEAAFGFPFPGRVQCTFRQNPIFREQSFVPFLESPPHQCLDSPLAKLPFSMFDPETERQLCLPVLPCTVTRQLPWGDFSLKCRRFAPPVTIALQQLATQVQNFVLKMSCSGVFRWVLSCVLSETC